MIYNYKPYNLGNRSSIHEFREHMQYIYITYLGFSQSVTPIQWKVTIMNIQCIFFFCGKRDIPGDILLTYNVDMHTLRLALLL